VYTPIQAGFIQNKEQLKGIISDITSGSSTNLSGGMMEGYSQVALNFKSGFVNRVLLLTDGLANTGITNPHQLKNIVTDKNRNGYTLSTFGVGSDFNEDLMTSLAEFGGANYYFINNAEEIPQIFSNELQGLLSVVAQNVTLEINLNNGVQIIDVFGYSYESEHHVIKIKLNDMFSEEQKSILVKLSLPKMTYAKEDLCNIRLTYDDVMISNSRITETFQTTINLTDDNELVQKNKNPVVYENIALFESTKLLDDAMTFFDQRNYDSAEQSIKKNISLLQKSINYQSSKRLKQQMINVFKYSSEYEQVEEMNEEEQKVMQKNMKYKNYLQKKKK